MKYRGLVLAILLCPTLALAQTTTPLELSQKTTVDGTAVPVRATISAQSQDGVILSQTKEAGSIPVTLTFYIRPKPKPVAATSSAAAAIESSAGIQHGIAGVSPTAADLVKPAFVLVDGGRNSVADVLDSQLAVMKQKIGPSAGSPSEILGAEQTKNAGSDPLGAVWFILQTLYFYLLTLLRFIVGSAAVFYPVVVVAFFYIMWRLLRRIRRPA